MARIKGIRIILYEKIEIGKDKFGTPIYEQLKIPIDNVLIAPASSDDIVHSTNLFGKKVAYTLGIPKNDKHDWEDATVEFFGQKFRTFGKPTQGIAEMIPLAWNKKVMVEAYE